MDGSSTSGRRIRRERTHGRMKIRRERRENEGSVGENTQVQVWVCVGQGWGVVGVCVWGQQITGSGGKPNQQNAKRNKNVQNE